MRTALYSVLVASLFAAGLPAAMAAQSSPSPAVNNGAGGTMVPQYDDATGIQAPDDAPAQIKKVQVIGLTQLPPPIRKEVDQKVASSSASDMRQLRHSIDATPELAKSLKDYGTTSAQVVAVNLDSDGLLTLIVSA